MSLSRSFPENIDDTKLSQIIVQKVLDHYERLPKKGKPRPEEWTTLASFVVVDAHQNIEVVSCATGTRCLGKSLLDKNGNRVHDSHAEILARRAFQRYLIAEISHIYQNKKSRFLQLNEQSRVETVPGVKVVFFSSQTPCGDASIFPRQPQDIHPEMKRKSNISIESEGQLTYTSVGQARLCANRFKQEDSAAIEMTQISCNGDSISKTQDLPSNDFDLYRTGAKCVQGCAQDSRAPGSSYHVTEVLRTKPGKGDPTLSLSCSDKLARWNVLGCQGCLPMIFLSTPIYLDHIIISGCVADKRALIRALYARLLDTPLLPPGGYKVHRPDIQVLHHIFPHGKFQAGPNCIAGYTDSCERIRPCDTSLIWYKISNSESVTEVAVNGYKQGTTKKDLTSIKARLSVSRSSMFADVHKLFNSLNDEKKQCLGGRENLPTSYQKCKELVSFMSLWNKLSSTDCLFSHWPRKDAEYSKFSLLEV